jgi:hypothetical protein
MRNAWSPKAGALPRQQFRLPFSRFRIGRFRWHRSSPPHGISWALEADPDSSEPLVNLGGALLNLKRPQDALEYNLRAVIRRPNNALAKYHRNATAVACPGNSQLGLDYFEVDDPDRFRNRSAVAFSISIPVRRSDYLDDTITDCSDRSISRSLELKPAWRNIVSNSGNV